MANSVSPRDLVLDRVIAFCPAAQNLAETLLDVIVDFLIRTGAITVASPKAFANPLFTQTTGDTGDRRGYLDSGRIKRLLKPGCADYHRRAEYAGRQGRQLMRFYRPKGFVSIPMVAQQGERHSSLTYS